MRFKPFDNIMKSYAVSDEYKTLIDLIEELREKVQLLEDQVKELQHENIEATNSMYEIANSLEARIDILASEPYNLDKFAVENNV